MQIKHRMQMEVGKKYYVAGSYMDDPSKAQVEVITYKGITTHLITGGDVLLFLGEDDRKGHHYDQDVGIGPRPHNFRRVYSRQDEAQEYCNRLVAGNFTPEEKDLMDHHEAFLAMLDLESQMYPDD